MKSVLISIQPKWCELIASGKKTVEVRKSRPKLEMPFKVYIYCTQGKFKDLGVIGNKMYQKRTKVIGEFVCDRIDTIGKRGCDNNFDYCYLSLNVFGNDDIGIEITDIKKSCIPKYELNAYGENTSCIYAWHISDLVIYDKPRVLSEFFIYCGDNPKCDGCEAHYYSNTECGKEDYCCSIIDGHRPLKRPPQSWCYVEEGGKG